MMGPYLKNLRARVGSECVLLPGVRGIVVNRFGEVLLQCRTDVNRWGLPAGSLELDETALEALQREVREETSLEIRNPEPMAIYSGPSQRFEYPNGDRIQCFSIAFIIRDWSGKPRADGIEGSLVEFFPLNRLPEDLVGVHAQTLNDYKRYDGEFIISTPERKE